MSTASVTALINALRAETVENSISPDSLGYILQQMLNEHEDIPSGSSSGSSSPSSEPSSNTSAEILALQTSVSNLQSRATQLQSAITILQNAALNISSTITADHSALTALQDEVDNLTTLTDNLSERIEELEEAAGSASSAADITAISQSLVALNREVSSLSTNATDLAEALDSANTDIATLEQRIDTLSLISTTCLRFAQIVEGTASIFVTTNIPRGQDDALIRIMGNIKFPLRSIDMLVAWRTEEDTISTRVVSRGEYAIPGLKVTAVDTGLDDLMALWIPVPEYTRYMNLQFDLFDENYMDAEGWVAETDIDLSGLSLTRWPNTAVKAPLDTDISGTAQRAVADAEGNIITDTYMPLTDLSSTPIRQVVRSVQTSQN